MTTIGKEVVTSSFDGVSRNSIALAYLPRPDYLEFSLPTTHIALLTNDGSALTQAVYEALKAKGNQVVVLNLAGIDNQFSNHSINLAANTDAAIGTVIQTIQTQYGAVGTFIHLHPHLPFTKGQFNQHFDLERSLLQAVFLIAKHIQANLNALGKQQRANFVTLTRLDGRLGLGKRSNTSVVGGGLSGLVKSLNLEWSAVYCRAVDAQPEWSNEQLTQHLMQELHDPNGAVTEVALSDQGRATLVATVDPVQAGKSIQTTITEEAVFLVSGGARGVTANCVIEMANAFRCKFILLGRSDAHIPLPDFAQQTTDESTLKRAIMLDLKAKGQQPNFAKVKQLFKNIIAKKEIDATLHAIQEAGGEAVYLQADVTQPSSVHPQLLAIQQQWGTITGIIHGAGCLADKYIQDKSEADFNKVLSVKLDGLLTLLQSVQRSKLQHLILFSSVAGFYGNVGQTDYAIANEILSKAAHLFSTNHPNTHVSAINWGAWDAGMVSDALKKKFEALGVSLVSSVGGPALLINELNNVYAQQPQVILGGTLPAGISYTAGDLTTHKIHRSLEPSENPFLQHHVIQGQAVLPVVSAMGWMATTAEQLFPDFRTYEVADTKLFKGLVFDGNQPKDFVITLTEKEKNDTTIVLETTISSHPPKATLPTFHYKAFITLRSKNAPVEQAIFEPCLSGQYQPSSGAVLYENGALFHGAHFQGIEEILDCNTTQIVLKCKAPQVARSEQGQFPVLGVNTFFADIQYQGMVVWVQQFHDGAKSLPLTTKSAQLFAPIPFDKELFVHIQIIENTPFKMVANCTTYDEAGKVYCFTQQAAVTISKELAW